MSLRHMIRKKEMVLYRKGDEDLLQYFETVDERRGEVTGKLLDLIEPHGMNLGSWEGWKYYKWKGQPPPDNDASGGNGSQPSRVQATHVADTGGGGAAQWNASDTGGSGAAQWDVGTHTYDPEPNAWWLDLSGFPSANVVDDPWDDRGRDPWDDGFRDPWDATKQHMPPANSKRPLSPVSTGPLADYHSEDEAIQNRVSQVPPAAGAPPLSAPPQPPPQRSPATQDLEVQPSGSLSSTQPYRGVSLLGACLVSVDAALHADTEANTSESCATSSTDSEGMPELEEVQDGGTPDNVRELINKTVYSVPRVITGKHKRWYEQVATPEQRRAVDIALNITNRDQPHWQNRGRSPARSSSSQEREKDLSDRNETLVSRASDRNVAAVPANGSQPDLGNANSRDVTTNPANIYRHDVQTGVTSCFRLKFVDPAKQALVKQRLLKNSSRST